MPLHMISPGIEVQIFHLAAAAVSSRGRAAPLAAAGDEFNALLEGAIAGGFSNLQFRVPVTGIASSVLVRPCRRVPPPDG